MARRKKWKKSEMKPYKELLLQLRARLRGDVQHLANAALSENTSSTVPLHLADIGSENFEQEFALTLVASEEETLEQIEGGLERIESGTYGFCTNCEGTIPKMRLNAIPYTPHCIKCAEIIQQR